MALLQVEPRIILIGKRIWLLPTPLHLLVNRPIKRGVIST
jgi:hypothetical protein